ncbi:hypothetical protein AWENTII_009202 [Aspergillus wentii]
MMNLATDRYVEQAGTSDSVDGMAAVEELILRDKVDILYDPRVCARRRWMELPTQDPEICSHLK